MYEGIPLRPVGSTESRESLPDLGQEVVAFGKLFAVLLLELLDRAGILGARLLEVGDGGLVLGYSTAGLLMCGLEGVEGGAVRFTASLFFLKEFSEFTGFEGL